LNTLKITEGADYNPEKACLPGTRTDVLESIRNWITGEGEHADTQAFLLVGQAGIGKSAILHRIAEEYNVTQRLAASFCFSKDRGSNNFFRTIARSFAALDPAFALAVAASTTRDPTLKTTSVLTSQIKYLLKEPLQSLSVLGTILIVIDALDECYEDRDELVQHLDEFIPTFPKNIRFIITSRPSEATYLRQFSWVHTHTLETATNADLYTFVGRQLTEYGSKKLIVGFDASKIQNIVTAAEGLFQHATVVCKEITNVAKTRQKPPLVVYTALISSGSQGLDSLYSHILYNAYNLPLTGPVLKERVEWLHHFRELMGWILYACSRLSRKILLDFGSVSMHDAGDTEFGLVVGILLPLGALLSGTNDSGGDIYPLHSSFRDFLTNKERSGNFYVGSASDQHGHLASTCLAIMTRDLHFNMAKLQNSYVLNRDVVNFASKVNTGISRALSYACRNWTWHLEKYEAVEKDFAGLDMIAAWAKSLFLFWLETLALEKQTTEAVSAYTFLVKWIKVIFTPLKKS